MFNDENRRDLVATMSGRFQRQPSLGTSIARAMIVMSSDMTFDMTSDQSTNVSMPLCDSMQSFLSNTSCFSPSTAISHIRHSSTSSLDSSTE
jgi:hypothetical protein